MTDVTWAEVDAAFRRLELEAVAAAPWFGGRGHPVEIVRPVEAFDLGRGAALAVAEAGERGQTAGRYLFPLVRRADGPVAIASEGDGAWRALAAAMAEGRTIPAVPRRDPAGARGPVTAALVCRPASRLGSLVPGGAPQITAAPERPLDAGQTNTLAVLGDTLLLKAFRRIEDGLNPDLELTAWLAEEVRFGGVPAVAGYAELVTGRGAA